MKKTSIFLLSGLAGMMWVGCSKKDASTTPAPEPDPVICPETVGANSADVIEGTYIVAYDPTVVNTRGLSSMSLSSKSDATLQRHAIPASRKKGDFGGSSGGFIANLTPDEVIALKKDNTVAHVEADRVISLTTCFSVVNPNTVTWNVTRVGYGDGTGKVAWVIDSGIDSDHPDLTVDANRSRSFINGKPSYEDENGHGTHVAGVIAGNNNQYGVLGVAAGATVVSLRVLDEEGSGTLSSVIQALAYVSQNGKAGDVVNLSLGEDVTSQILIQQVQSTASRGIYIAIAAGNSGEAANKYSPANANGPNIYTVSAVDSLDRFATFSNFGNDVVDYAAPGVRILSTYSNARYAYASGTSMAAPHVAGLLLLRGNAIKTSGYATNDPDGTPDPIAHK